MEDAGHKPSNELIEPPILPESPLALQFSLRSIFVLTTIVAVIVTILYAVPDPAATPAMLVMFIVWASVLVQIIVFSRGHLRTFAIGAAAPAVIAVTAMAFWIGWFVVVAIEMQPAVEVSELGTKLAVYLRPFVGINLLLSFVMGVAAFITRWAVRGKS